MGCRWLPTAFACVAIANAGLPAAIAAEDWVEQSSYYEEEAWYEITQWFDGNDYQRTEALNPSVRMHPGGFRFVAK